MTETRIQIIAFIRREVFCQDWLSGCTNEIALGSMRNPLEGGQMIIYLTPDGTREVGTYDNERANSALYMLVPDECEGWKKAAVREPTVPFKFLWHSKTSPDMYQGLKDSKYCRGFKESSHEVDSLYHKIAQDIITIVGGNPPCPDPIWNEIPDINWIAEAKCRLISICTAPERVKDLLENFNNNDSRVKELLLLDKQKIMTWLQDNSDNGEVDIELLRKELGMDE